MLWSKACVLFIFLLNFQLNDTLTFVPVGKLTIIFYTLFSFGKRIYRKEKFSRVQ